jgi:hypothetical protein
MSKPISPIRPLSPTWNSRVRTCDNLLGRISFIWPALHSAQRDGGELRTLNPQPSTRLYFRVSFGIPSPYFDHWAVYRQHEVTLLRGNEVPLRSVISPVIQAVVASMRPRIPKK